MSDKPAVGVMAVLQNKKVRRVDERIVPYSDQRQKTKHKTDVDNCAVLLADDQLERIYGSFMLCSAIKRATEMGMGVRLYTSASCGSGATYFGSRQVLIVAMGSFKDTIMRHRATRYRRFARNLSLSRLTRSGLR
ncbi:uncharacterized protein PHALS_03020 [Plasmopara halstedii]|uniref:Uncharacterized protein n=1 Tax=Plasmopara halstedii TaxID=4781 RepID=A0A0P1A809_PLAHL|nr:uncharacterized protein PHALS_03020 [Plasmopara halstedii]CEG36471.1 hypothetical protein PHALS_03020 [Plasmopara halstedii]|eukprot:XP_024572840.1 hypothetical protein PHALS_03020 [Plasmopara halstedii]